MKKQTFEMHTRTLEVCVNRILRAVDDLNLNGVEAAFALAKALEHVEQRAGFKVDRALLIPDKEN